MSDAHLRELERRAASGDFETDKRLKIEQCRMSGHTLAEVFSFRQYPMKDPFNRDVRLHHLLCVRCLEQFEPTIEDELQFRIKQFAKSFK